MNIVVPKEIVKLAELFKKNGEKLYLVGGYVRNKLLGVGDDENLDIDVCSSCLPEKVIKICQGSPFKAEYMNKELGVVEIINNIRVEHATFRSEKYAFSGVHIPENVEFIKDLAKDAERRDFRCNAIYYDILDDDIVDPLNGLDDVRKKIIQTTLKPDVVFSSDGERILRMVRLAATLGFWVEEKTYESAKKNAYKIGSLSSTRKREEFSRIVLADTEYRYLTEKKYAHARAVAMLADIGALGYVLPALEEIRKSNLLDDRNKPLFEHIMNVFALSRPEVRLSALLHDVGKAKAMMNYNNFHGEEEYASVIIEKNLGTDGLNYSKKIVERVKRVVLGVNFNKYGYEFAKTVRHYIAENIDDIELIIALKNAIAKDKSNMRHGSYSASILERSYKRMKEKNTPFKLSDLNIKGDVLIAQIPELAVKKTGALLEALLYKCIDKPFLNTERNLLLTARELVKKKKKLYTE